MDEDLQSDDKLPTVCLIEQPEPLPEEWGMVRGLRRWLARRSAAKLLRRRDAIARSMRLPQKY